MGQIALEKFKYPIGEFEIPKSVSESDISLWVEKIKSFPKRLANVVEPLNDDQLNTPYRPGGWTVRQVVHHLADSHHHAYTRFKWALTEDRPTIKAYDENQWVQGSDYAGPVFLSLNYLAALHEKLTYLLENLEKTDLNRAFIHPATGNEVILKNMVGMYAWHGDHHLAHITSLAKREAWS
ncbi:MAG TPA: putative metal-dependent hydrolase [Leeuwenhoekiella sp.]|nr:putative metal-dependent hydrolase [Leeuwenhoekiella sp.]